VRKIRKSFSIVALLCASQVSFAQPDTDQQLAQEYLQNAEYDKAVVLYEKLFTKQPGNQLYYQNYLTCLEQLGQFDDGEKMIKKQIKRNGKDLSYYVDLGNLYQLKGNSKAANEQYQLAISLLQSDQYQISRLANRFYQSNLLDEAIQTYVRAKKIFHAEENSLYDNEIANLYRKKGDPENTVKYYLDLVQHDSNQQEFVQSQMQSLIPSKDYASAFQAELFRRIQKDPNNPQFPDMLIWFYIQQKDFASAFLQVKALDKRNHEEGDRIFQFAQSAFQEGNYDAALMAYRFIISEKGKSSYLYMPARASELTTERTKITVQNTFTQEELLKLETDYENYFSEFGKTSQTAAVMRDYASLEAKFLHNLDKCIAILNEALEIGSNDQRLVGYLKLDLGDAYVIKGEVWEAMLLYGQVDKTFGDEPIGEEARFKNAKLNYYIGDFDWSKTQLDILKGATTELVANDAIALSVFLTDNMGLDTSAVPMEMYARADLYIFQNLLDSAAKTLDSIKRKFPDGSLMDDVLFAEGRIFLAQRNYEEAAEIFSQIDETYSFDLLADDALFQLAELYDKYLHNTDKAMDLYKQILTKYKGSIFTVEARKRYRELRGDEVN